jgi:hypothetical protein
MSKEWAKIDETIKQIRMTARKVEELEKQKVEAYQALRKLILDAYQAIPQADCLFFDCPLSPQRVLYAHKAYQKKLGYEGITDVFKPEVEIPEFSKVIDDGCLWLMKFKKNEKAG